MYASIGVLYNFPIPYTWLISILMEESDPTNLHTVSQYHSYWWIGNVKSQAISSHDIDLICPQ